MGIWRLFRVRYLLSIFAAAVRCRIRRTKHDAISGDLLLLRSAFSSAHRVIAHSHCWAPICLAGNDCGLPAALFFAASSPQLALESSGLLHAPRGSRDARAKTQARRPRPNNSKMLSGCLLCNILIRINIFCCFGRRLRSHSASAQVIFLQLPQPN
jgi:hypothetical protein